MESYDKYALSVYKKTNGLQKRMNQSSYVKTKYPDLVPIILEYSNDFPPEYRLLHKQKYLIPKTYKLSDFMVVIRKQIKLPAKKAMCLLVSGTLLRATDNMEDIYAKYKDKDDFLYITLIIESTFG